MAFIDYYKILGVSKDIPQKDVREAYRKRAKQFHPDLHPNDPKAKAKFQALNEAYDVISDPEKRAKYDRYGEQWKNADAFGGGFGGTGGGNPFGGFGGGGGHNPFEGFDFSGFSGGSGGGFSSFFQDLFGKRGNSRSGGCGSGGCGHFTPSEKEAKVNVDLYTALLGGDVIIQLGMGHKVKLKVKPCTQNGTKVRLRGKGYPKADGTMGDLIIVYNVQLPTTLSEKQQQLLEEMRRNA